MKVKAGLDWIQLMIRVGKSNGQGTSDMDKLGVALLVLEECFTELLSNTSSCRHVGSHVGT